MHRFKTPRRSQATRQRRRRFERLEDRLVLSATGVGDAQFALYDAGVISTVDPTFSRGVETVNGLGESVAADARRFGEPVAYSPTVEWDAIDIDFLPFDGEDIRGEVLATGWDHDGTTPLMVFMTSGFRTDIYFVRGEDFEVVNRISYSGADLLQGTVEERRYLPMAAVIHHGLVAFAVQRSVPEGSGYTPTGVDFITTQDYGQTLDRVPVVGGGFETPAIAGDVSRGMWRLESWSFSSPFPVSGIDDTEAVWFPWADYISRLYNPKGGQTGLFRADRDAESGEWIISPNRVIYESWEQADTGGYHSHAAAITEGGLITHWGDVGYRSVTRFHEFDLSNYETATVTTVDAYGDYRSTPELQVVSPQPAAVAPSPVPGEHITTGDTFPDHVLSYGSMEDLDSRLVVRAERYSPERTAPGGIFAGAEILHINWLQGVGYTIGSRADPYFYYSKDGDNWSEIITPDGEKGRIWLYGEQLLAYQDGLLRVAALPSVEVVRPLQIAPGGVNELATDLEWLRDPGQGNTAQEVVFTQGLWRYADSSDPLDIQPPPPPFHADSPVYEITIGEESQYLGALWLQPEGQASDSSLQHLTQMWVANLETQTVTFGANHGPRDEEALASVYSGVSNYRVSDNDQWTAVGVSNSIDGDLDARFVTQLYSEYQSPGARFLVGITHFEATASPTYPLAPQASGPDEIERLDDLALSGDWSLGLVTHWPEDAPLRINNLIPIASLTGPTGDAIELSVEQSERSRLVVTTYDEGQLVDEQKLWLRFRKFVSRDDFIDFTVSRDEQSLRFSAVVSGEKPLQMEIAAAWDLDLDTFSWADRTGDVVAATDPVLVTYDQEAWDLDQHLEWLQSPLSEKALYRSLPSTGDFNSDGSVDAADYAVWRDTLYDNTPGRPGDMNSDGDIDEHDAVIWRSQYGVAGDGWSADLNSDAVVDAADYTIWRDLAAPQIRPGAGADADGNSYVQQEDYLLWRDVYGAEYPTLEGLRSQAALAFATSTPTEVADQEPQGSTRTPLAMPARVSLATAPVVSTDQNTSSPIQDDQSSSDLLLYWRQLQSPASQRTAAAWSPEEEEHEALDAALAQDDSLIEVLNSLPTF